MEVHFCSGILCVIIMYDQTARSISLLVLVICLVHTVAKDVLFLTGHVLVLTGHVLEQDMS